MTAAALRRHPGLALVATVSVIALLVGACAKKTSSASGGQSITITSPVDGASVTSPVKLVLSVQGAKIGPPESGDMHFHVYVSGGKACQPLGYCVVTSTDGTVTAPPGKHTLKVVLAEPNHDETATTASVTVNVTGGSAGASPSPTGGYGQGGYGGGGGGYGGGNG